MAFNKMNRPLTQLKFRFGAASDWMLDPGLRTFAKISDALRYASGDGGETALYVYDDKLNLLMALPIPQGEFKMKDFVRILYDKVYQRLRNG